MIAVSGSPRCGTSLMMQTLKILGIEVPAPKFHSYMDGSNLYDDYIDANPYGYYEFEDNTDLRKLPKDCAIKVTGSALLSVDNSFIDKVIICRRDMIDAVNSIIDSSEAHSRNLRDDNAFKGAMRIYKENIAYAEEYVQYHSIPSIDVYYEDMVGNPEQTIWLIAGFVGKFDGYQEAINNVRRR